MPSIGNPKKVEFSNIFTKNLSSCMHPTFLGDRTLQHTNPDADMDPHESQRGCFMTFMTGGLSFDPLDLRQGVYLNVGVVS